MRKRGGALLLAMLMAAAAQAGDEKPFPVDHSTILREGGVVYVIEGRQKIPWGCEISCQKDVKIIGRSDAVLEVEGELTIHGVLDREVIIEGVWIEPSPKFQDIQLDMVKWRNGGGLRTPKGQPVRGSLVLENVKTESGVGFDVSFAGGLIRMINSGFRQPVYLRGVPEEGKDHSTVKIDLISCFMGAGPDGFDGGLTLERIYKPTVRNCRMGGSRTEFLDCEWVTFDGNKVNSEYLVFKNATSGGFKGTKVQKCDIYSRQVLFQAPAGKSRETVILDKCWFKGLKSSKEILEKVISDADDSESNGVSAKFRKVMERPLELAGAVDR